jgi:hypothetical protein
MNDRKFWKDEIFKVYSCGERLRSNRRLYNLINVCLNGNVNRNEVTGRPDISSVHEELSVSSKTECFGRIYSKDVTKRDVNFSFENMENKTHEEIRIQFENKSSRSLVCDTDNFS